MHVPGKVWIRGKAKKKRKKGSQIIGREGGEDDDDAEDETKGCVDPERD